MRRFLDNSNYKLLIDSIENGENVSVFGLNIGEKLALVENSAFLFYIVDNINKVNDVCDRLLLLGRSPEILVDDINPLTSEFVTTEKYIKILLDIKNGTIDSLVITPEVLASKFPSKDILKSLELAVNQEININNLVKNLVGVNYKRVDLVSNPGEFSLRGDILDIYPIGYKPSRIFMDYDIIESIKLYNPITMLTTSEIDRIEIVSNNYFQVTQQDIKDIYAQNKLKIDDTYDELLELRNNDYRLMLFDNNQYVSIFDYVKGADIVFDGAKTIYDKLEEHIKEFNENLFSLPKVLEKIIKLKKIDINKCLDFPKTSTLIAFHYISQANRFFRPNKVFSIRTLPSTNYCNYFDTLYLDLCNFLKQNYTIILCAGNEENVIKISKFLDDKNIKYNKETRLALCLRKSVNIIPKNYPNDILLAEDKFALISTNSLFGKKKKVVESNGQIFDGEVPKNGDYVVHSFHGIGKCLGVKTLKISDSQRDYVLIEYKNNDKLYLPVENMDQISKYLGSEKAPTLNKIGGVEFAKTKSRVKSAVKKIAFDLIGLYRNRMNLKGYKYFEDDEMQVRFEEAFGFSETDDQLKAINDCKLDMQNGKVMDRLICGDVGFGKTEVALRIAFKTIMNGKQVAFLCPTTILSEQHYNTALERMSNFGVKIDVVNRLRTTKDIDKIKKEISSGKIDLICGTHKLLSSDIDYKNLGLLILDEEQKFGVADKEKIKNIKNQINVLTLSATPIPRTLNMSLIGVRDISVIETPPVERLNTEVKVLEYSDIIVKSAIEKELARDGQVLIIYNRVESIYNFAGKIKMLVPSAKVSVAHGQMDSKELEKEIMNLYSRKTQVLISTTLIENGVDLPNANTLVVINSDKLGLSQLYQLKGRIGRSNKESYAYFTFDGKKSLSENAYKRLEAIQEFSSMGSGFKIALRDLEIRGAGSLLGLEQSGHIEKIGYNLYVQLLNESVLELKNQKVERKSDVRVETNISAYLSNNYVSSMASRMKMYKEISSIDSLDKMIEFLKNTEDIYGEIPKELNNLVKIAYIKNMCSLLGVTKISIKDKTNIYLGNKESLTRNIVDISMDNYKDNINFNLIDLPIIEVFDIDKKDILDFLINYLQLIS